CSGPRRLRAAMGVKDATLSSRPLLFRPALARQAERRVPTIAVLLHPLPAAAPCAVIGPNRLQPGALRGVAECDCRQILARQGLQWNELRRPGDGGQNEPGEVVEDRPRDQLAKGAGIVSVGSVQSRKIPIPLALLNDGRWIAEANK